MQVKLNPPAAGESGRTRRAGEGGGGKYYPGYLRNKAPSGQTAIESSQHELSNACLIFII